MPCLTGIETTGNGRAVTKLGFVSKKSNLDAASNKFEGIYP